METVDGDRLAGAGVFEVVVEDDIWDQSADFEGSADMGVLGIFADAVPVEIHVDLAVVGH